MYWLIRKIKDCFYSIKGAIQRVYRGYDDRAVGNIDFYLLGLIPDVIKDLRETTQSYPNEFNYPEIKTFEDWEAILARIEFCLREANEETCSKKNKYEEEYDNQLLTKTSIDKDGLWHDKVDPELFEKWNAEENELWDYRNKMKDEALDLLKKYWWTLGD